MPENSIVAQKDIIEDTIICNLVVSAGQKLLRNYVDAISYVKTIFLLFLRRSSVFASVRISRINVGGVCIGIRNIKFFEKFCLRTTSMIPNGSTNTIFTLTLY